MSKPLTIARLPPPSCCFHSIEPPAKQVKSDPDAPETTATEPAAEPATEGTTEQTSKETETPPEDDKTATEPPASAPGLPPGVPPLNGSTDTPAATTPGDNEDDPTIEEKAEVSALYVGRVIGKGGEMIRDLQARSGCRMDVDQNVPAGSPRIITYRGTRKTVDFAKEMVAMLCTPNGNEAQLPLGEASREQVQVPSTSVGKIIGRGGEMIRELQSKSQAKIQVDHAVGPSDTRTVTITGTPPSVIKAKEMVEFLVANPMMDAMAAIQMLLQDKLHRGGQWGSGPPYPNMPNQGQGMTGGGMFGGGGGGGGGYGQNSYGPPQNQQYGYQQQAPPQQYGGQQQPSNYYGGGGGGGAPGGGGETEVFFAAKMYMGRIIGQKGVTVNDLQKRSGCDIQINQDVPPGQDCEITLRGTRAGIESAKKMLNDVIQMGPAHPYAGGGGREYFGWILSLTLSLSLSVSASPTHSLTNTRVYHSNSTNRISRHRTGWLRPAASIRRRRRRRWIRCPRWRVHVRPTAANVRTATVRTATAGLRDAAATAAATVPSPGCSSTGSVRPSSSGLCSAFSVEDRNCRRRAGVLLPRKDRRDTMGQASRHALIPTRGSLNLCCCCRRRCCCCGGDDEPKRERGKNSGWGKRNKRKVTSWKSNEGLTTERHGENGSLSLSCLVDGWMAR